MRTMAFLLSLLFSFFFAETGPALPASTETSPDLQTYADGAAVPSSQETWGNALRASTAPAETRAALQTPAAKPIPEKQIPDSTWRKLDAKLEEYVRALERASAAEKAVECDFILETASNPAIRNHAARKLFDHYRHSPVMGDEAVAVHLTDKWFRPGTVTFEKEEELFDAQVFADFNRASLIGKKAPMLTLRTPEDTTAVFPVADGRMKILYFYDTDCAACKLMTPVLVSWLENNRPEAGVTAVYVGDKAEEWAVGRAAFAKTGLPVSHRWDPELESDFQRLYGLLQTPKLFLIDEAGIIVGRGLDVPALHLLLFRHHVGSVTAPLVDEGSHVGREG